MTGDPAGAAVDARRLFAAHRPRRMPAVRDDDRVDSRDRVSGRNRWIIGALVAQVFLVTVFVAIATADSPPPLKVVTSLLLLVFSGTYVFVVGRLLQASLVARMAVTGVMLVLTLPIFLVLGPSTSSLWIFVAVAGGMLYPAAGAMTFALVLAVAMLVIDVIAGEPPSWELALTLVALTAFMVGFADNIRLNIELRATREELAVAAVAAERERIGRDLHDILGHSLTAIAVKAGLARRLLDRDPPAAATEIADVESLAREALKDVRATASGYREVSLAEELTVAAAVLRAAGIAAHLPATADGVEPMALETFGYVLREAVTNVVRHSGAQHCSVTLGARSIEITDDGSGEPAAGSGSGLHNLADRLAARGGSLSIGPGPAGGYTVRASLPAVALGTPGVSVAGS